MDPAGNRQSSLAITFLIAGVALLVGALIYLLFRPTHPLFLEWLEFLGADTWIAKIRATTGQIISPLPNSLVYSLPQGLWAFAYALIITALWGTSIPRLRRGFFWLGSIPLVASGFEFLQYCGAIIGTACPQDLIFSVVGALLGGIAGWLRRIPFPVHES